MGPAWGGVGAACSAVLGVGAAWGRRGGDVGAAWPVEEP